MIYSRAIATSGLLCLQSQKLSGDAFTQLNGARYSLLTRRHCSPPMLICIGATAEGHFIETGQDGRDSRASSHASVAVMEENMHDQQLQHSWSFDF